MPLILVIIILLLIWGNISRRSASHPMNAVSVVSSGGISKTPPTIICQHPSGDSFMGGTSIVSGVCEPHILHCNVMNAGVFTCNVAPIIPIHITMPIAPPPIAIQRPAPLKPAPVSPIVSAGGLLWGTSPTPVKRQPVICSRGGNGPGWCVDKLNQLASQHCHMGVGCGAF